MWPFPSFGFVEVLGYVWSFPDKQRGFPEMCWASPLPPLSLVEKKGENLSGEEAMAT